MSYHCIRWKLSTERDINVLTQKLIITVVSWMGGKRKLQDIVLWSWRKARVTKHMGVQAKEHGRVPCRPHVIGQVNNQLFIAGLPRARSARGTEPHTHGIWSTSFRLVVTWLTERTYASTDCMGGVGETIKRKGGVSQACLGKSTSLI